ncbi:MAG: ABC transporter permease [Polyangiaceae bacterium]|nr:ABC transporter permease [Polyangiaceae bacterium]
MIWLTLSMALREIRRNAMRSFLTMLGIVIGVGAVITMVTIGNGASAQVRKEVSSLGEDLIMIRPGADRGPGGVREAAKSFESDDVHAIRSEVPGLIAVTGSASRSATIVYGNANWSSTVTGCDMDYLTVSGHTVAQGRTFLPTELVSATPVCIIGTTVQKELFGVDDPLGLRIRVGTVSCQVVGVLAEKGESSMGQDKDDTILMPLATFQRRLAGSTDISSIQLKVAKNQSVNVVQSQVEALLAERRRILPGKPNDFSVRNVQEIASAMSSVTTTLTGLLGGIAGVSLLVGGIGIMNIMLVSVTERTREIGTRLAIGALGSEVLLQFLVEAIMLSVLGGIIGIVTGLGASYLVTSMMAMPFVVSAEIVLGAFAFSMVVGIAFGYLPARQAARLNPIEALRHE